MTIKYYTKNVYGNTLKYLVTTEENTGEPARAILALIGKQTIDDRDMELLGYLGIEFERVFEPTK